MNVTITAHRPERLTDQDRICNDLLVNFEDLGAYRVIQGMAPGGDLLAARSAYRAGIPYVCAKPYPTHRTYVERNYSGWLSMYDRALEFADEVVDVSDRYTGKHVFQVRNVWMVDRGDVVLSVWDGEKGGGTWNAIKYAQQKGKKTVNVAP